MADFDGDQRALAIEALRLDGHDAIEVRDGQELLDALANRLFAAEDPSLPLAIVCEVDLPIRGGIDVMVAVHRAGLRVPFVLTSRREDRAERERARGQGAAAFLDKPVSPHSLVHAVRRVVDPSAGRAPRLLVAVADAARRAWLRARLEERCVEVDEARSSWEALTALARETPYDAIVLGTAMGLIDERTVVAVARKAGITTPFLIVGECHDDLARARLARLQRVAVLPDSVDTETLLTRARALGDRDL